MASTTSSTSSATNSPSPSFSIVTPINLHHVMSIKLTRDNFLVWKAQLVSYLQGNSFLDISMITSHLLLRPFLSQILLVLKLPWPILPLCPGFNKIKSYFRPLYPPYSNLRLLWWSACPHHMLFERHSILCFPLDYKRELCRFATIFPPSRRETYLALINFKK
jgi:hypothetical protein